MRMAKRTGSIGLALAATLVLGTAVSALAQTTVMVDEDDSSWYFSDDHYGEDGELVTSTDGEGGFAEVPEVGDWGPWGYRLRIPDGQKARVMTDLYDGMLLSDLDGVSYSTYKTGLPGYGPSINIMIDPEGDDDFATLVWEANKAGHDIYEATWQDWDTSDGDGWWTPSIQPFSSSTPGSNENPTDLDTLVEHFGDGSTIIGFAVNVGRHGEMEAFVDGIGVTVDGATTVYDFEPAAPTKQDCKDGGWQELGYRNQGECVSFFARNR